MKTWLTADWHLGEDRFELMGRPFTSQMEMIDTLVQNHNKVVAPDDEVIMVGDVCYQKTPEFLPYVARFNGKKTLIRGNHDRVFTDEQLIEYFDTIVPEGGGVSIERNDIPLYITHYPSEGVKDRFNLVGHIHSAWKYQLNMLNIGVDVNHFRPVSMDKVPFHLGAIEKFYDGDVWVAYRDTNSSYQATRGKKNTYFRP
jgi:calcineurin-like phosphoesterase family protein